MLNRTKKVTKINPNKGINVSNINVFKVPIKEPTNEEKQLLAHFRIGVLSALKTLNLYAFQLTTMTNLVRQEEKVTLKSILQFTENVIKDIWRIKEAKFKGAEFDSFNKGLDKKLEYNLNLKK